ncbi:cadherin domain-containing protein [Wenzhouxiangella sp. EGI_FJ10305]|uniref:cadherin domain-containing protein n=1 Tax=Wenzhouxiangella sp. EGI_FJ10305 TaxID=3243768 RepID=UPI0035DAF1B4
MRTVPTSIQRKFPLLWVLVFTSLAWGTSAAFGAVTSEVTFGFSKYDGSLANGDSYTATIEADGTADQMTFSNWRIDESYALDFGVNMNNGGPDSIFADPAGDGFQFVSFTTEVFCGTSWSFDIVGYKDGSPVAGASQSYNLGGLGGPTTHSVGFDSVDEVRFENYSTNDGNQCLVIDDIVVDQEVVANTAPSFSNLDATVMFDEADGIPVVVDADATVADTEHDSANDYAGSTLTVAREGGANADDDFSFDTGAGTFTVSGGDLLTGGNVFASFTDNSGTLTVSFNSSEAAATSSLVDDVLQGVTYANTGSPVVVEYGLRLSFDDGGLQTSDSVPVEFDPELAPVTANTTWDFTELGPELSNFDPIDARIVTESTFELLFHGFRFGDASESGSIDSNELQLDQVTSDERTTGVRFESDEPFSLETIDIDNFSTFAQDVVVHAYLDNSLVDSRSFSYGASSGYQTRQFASANTAFANVDEIRVTTNVDESVALDNIVVDAGNSPPTVDLDTGAGGTGHSAAFSENTNQGVTASDGVAVTGPVATSDSDGSIESATYTLDNPQGDAGEGLAVDTAPLASALGFTTSSNQITITRNSASLADLIEAMEAVHYQNNSDTPDLTTRTVTVEVADDGGATASATATITIEAGNDTPMISGPGGTLRPDEDVAFDLSGANEIQIADVDAGGATVEVSVSANNGTLTLGSTTGLAFDSGGNGASAFTVSGTVTDLNNALSTLAYLGDPDYFGTDTISATVNDRGNTGTDPGLTGDASSEADSTTVSLDVQSVPDAPTITAIADQTTDEDTALSGIAFMIDDAETAASGLTLSFTAADPSLINSHAFGGSGTNRTLDIVPADDQNGATMITITVDDGGLSTQESFQLTINAVNDLPTVSPAISTFDTTVDEDASVPSFAFTVDDVESGGAGVTVLASSDNQTLVPDTNLSITDNGGGDRTLDITLAADENGTANITVTLDDGTDTVDGSFTLTVNAVNDPPAVSLDQSSDTIPENNGSDVTVAQITVEDDNEDGSTNDLSLNGPNAGNFAISGSDLVFTGSADFEAKDTYNVSVEVNDPAVGSTPDDTASFTLNISDVDEEPVFQATGPFSVDEAAGNGFAVGDVDATDGDGGATDANLTYAIVGGNTGAPFAIDGGAGAITVNDASAIDFDTSPTFSLDVEADDGTNAPTATVTVNVNNAAPSTPVDSDGASGGSVSEDAANGTAVGITADASDPAGGNVSYALTDDAGGRFQINAGTGIVTVADTSLIDFESATSHSITIVASDDDGVDSSPASFTIAVTDVDSPPEFTSTGPFAVGEAPSNGILVGDVDANDGDGGSADAGISYAITGGNASGAFAIDNSGVIEVADGSLIDFEDSASFVLTIEADDGGSTASATVTINVTDEPPSQPVDTDGSADSVAEDAANGDPVGVDVTSSDPAGGDITYTLTDDAGGRFAIDGAGVVTVADAASIDFENATSHTLVIEARDADGTASSSLTVTIAVTDVLETPTVTAPPGLTIDAAGLFTEVNLERDGTATADDDEDGSLTPTPEDITTPTWLRPGTHAITWSATDSDDQTGTDIQIVEVRPRVGIGPDRTVQEGTSIEIPIELNGDALDGTTPTIDVDVSGTSTADGADYAGLGAPLSVSILAGRTGTISFDVLDDGLSGEGPETLVLELTGTAGNTVLAERRQVTITIVEDNTPPVVSLEAQQGANNPAVIIDGTVTDTVTVSADTVDATSAADMTFDWNDAETGLVDLANDGDPATFEFDPSVVAPGIYDIEVTATDDDPSPLSGTASLRLRVIDPFPALTGADTDNDGLPDNDAAEGRPDRDGDSLPDYRDPYADRNTTHADLADPSGYRLETEPGLKLSIGRVAFAVDKDGSQVSAADITNTLGLTDARTNVGGYFDFRVDGLPTPGAVIDVVVPQRAAIPADPVYRKIDASGQWADFVKDGQDAVASAPGAPGYCPPTDDPAYTAGLTPGDWCVRLTIADGGPNDSDGVANARVVDPGGVAEAVVPPTITNAPATSVQQDSAYEYIPQVDDPDPGDTATFSISGQPAWTTFDTATGALTGTPGNADVGVYGNIEITVTDSYGETDSTGTFSIEVVNVNDAPTISGNPPGQVAQDNAYTFTPTADDIDNGDSLVFSIEGKPAWAAFDPVDGTLSGTPGNEDVGTYSGIEITVEDAAGASATLGPFAIEVTNVNDAPTLSAIADQTTDEDQPVGTIALTVGDVDDPLGDLSLSLSSDNPSLIGSFTFNGSGAQRSLDLSPAPDASGTANVTVSVSDGDLSTSQSFLLEVNPVNDPPEIVSTLDDIVIGGREGSISFDIRIDDVDTPVDSLVVTGQSDLQTLVPDANIVVTGTGAERQVEVTPNPNRSGSARITLIVDDGSDTARGSFDISVRPIAIPVLSWPGLLILSALMAALAAAGTKRVAIRRAE